LGNPWLIPHIQHYLRYQILLPPPAWEERIALALQHFERVLAYKGERIGLNEMRKHAVWYIKGLRFAAMLRNRIMQAQEVQEMKDMFCTIPGQYEQ